MALPSKVSISLGQRLWNSLSAWTVKYAGYQKLGLRREDLYSEDEYDVREAIRRLPEKEKNFRHYRMKRALDLTLKHSLLPKDQWTTSEEDVLYLTPYIEQVRREMKERKQWETQ